MAWVIRRQIKIDDYSKRDVYYEGSDYIRSGSAAASFSNDPDKALKFDSQQEGMQHAVTHGLIHVYGQNIQVVKHIG